MKFPVLDSMSPFGLVLHVLSPFILILAVAGLLVLIYLLIRFFIKRRK